MTFPEKCVLVIGGFFLVGLLQLGLVAVAGWWGRRVAERRALPDRHRLGL